MKNILDEKEYDLAIKLAEEIGAMVWKEIINIESRNYQPD